MFGSYYSIERAPSIQSECAFVKMCAGHVAESRDKNDTKSNTLVFTIVNYETSSYVGIINSSDIFVYFASARVVFTLVRLI